MPEAAQHKSSATAWIVSLAMVPVLYVLSYGPAWGLVYHAKISERAQGFCTEFYLPLLWLRMNTRWPAL